jgi:hypothetical protein
LTDTPSTKPLIDKLGVKPGMSATVINVNDASLLTELAARANVGTGTPPPEQDLVFYGVETADDMPRLTALRTSIKPNGAIWVVFRKGRKDFNENDVLRLGLDSGLVDVKIVRFSDTHSALKFVIRKKDR